MSMESYRKRVLTGEIVKLKEDRLYIIRETNDKKLLEEKLKVIDAEIAEVEGKLNQ